MGALGQFPPGPSLERVSVAAAAGCCALRVPGCGDVTHNLNHKRDTIYLTDRFNSAIIYDNFIEGTTGDSSSIGATLATDFYTLAMALRSRVHASSQASRGAKAESRRKPSPPGPKPAPGMVTTCAVSSSSENMSHELLPSRSTKT